MDFDKPKVYGDTFISDGLVMSFFYHFLSILRQKAFTNSQQFFFTMNMLKRLYMVRGASLMMLVVPMILKSNDNGDDDDDGKTKKRTQAVYVIKGAN